MPGFSRIVAKVRLTSPLNVSNAKIRLVYESAEPSEYCFSEEDRDRFSERHWRQRRAFAQEGHLRSLWREDGKRGSGAMSSLVPVLALSSYPGAPIMAAADLPKPDSAYTPWAYISTRRLAKLAGLDKKTAWRGLRGLARSGFAEIQTVGCHAQGGRKTWFRLNRKLFAENGEEYAMVPGHMVYSGTWMLLPTSACRHLYLALTALDPVFDEEALLASFREQYGITDRVEQKAKLLGIREAHAVSWSRLMRLTGLSRGTLEEALSILTAPIFDNGTIPLVRSGGKAGIARWYAVEKCVATWHWPVDTVNQDKEHLDILRRLIWPVIATKTRRKSRRRYRTERSRTGPMVGT